MTSFAETRLKIGVDRRMLQLEMAFDLYQAVDDLLEKMYKYCSPKQKQEITNIKSKLYKLNEEQYAEYMDFNKRIVATMNAFESKQDKEEQ